MHGIILLVGLRFYASKDVYQMLIQKNVARGLHSVAKDLRLSVHVWKDIGKQWTASISALPV